MATGFLRSRRDLLLENLALRQQPAVLKRRHPQPRFAPSERLFWVMLRQLWSGWKQALILVQPETVVRWHRAGFNLYWTWLSRHRVRAGRKCITLELRELIFRMVAENPSWRAELGISKDTVHRVWKEAGVKPHRLQRYMASDDPDFESMAADIIGLYLNPPEHAAVFCVDEKTAIQALDRLDPVLPLSPGRVERHGFEYYRHGTLSLYAALETSTGRVHGKTAARHTSRDLVSFLTEVVSLCPPRQRIHIILDNLSAHKTALVRKFLEQESACPFPLHTHVFLVAQPGGTLARQNRA
jgi:hypothetical protein